MNDIRRNESRLPLSAPFVEFTLRDCLPCDGLGWIGWGGCSRSHDCEECDGTGAKYRATWTTEDGIQCSMSGSGRTPPDADTRAVMEMVARGAREALGA